jgi:tRNA pseudouridine55 synthase
MTTAGFLAVDKPGAVTSHDVVAQVRRITGIRKAGHAGTLDPMATGLVLVALGGATRLIRFLQDLPKEYEATARFGIGTDSLDADGAETERTEMTVTLGDLQGLVPRFTGRVMQVPPMVSALKRDGRRLYDLARDGIEVEREARAVDIHHLEILSVGEGPHPDVRFRVVCGKGTYVRVVADDLARALGGPAHLTALRRTRTGSLSVDDHGLAFDALEGWRDRLLDPRTALRDLPAVVVDEATAARVRHGQRVESAPVDVAVDGAFRVIFDGRLLAVFRQSPDGPRSEVVLS